MSELGKWLTAEWDRFELRVRGGRTKKGRENNDLYYSSGWADGYMFAQKEARKAARIDAANARIGG